MQGFKSRGVRTSVGEVHVLEAEGSGDLPPIVLLHGFAASGVQMLPILMRLLPESRRLVVPDMPGHGFSAVPDNGVHGGSLREGLVEALDAVLERPAVLFGNSMGGLAAIRYALERRSQVCGLVLCSPGGAAMQPHELDQFRAVFDIDSHADALEFVDRLLGRRSPFRHALALSVRRRLSRPQMRSLMASVTPDDLLQPEQLGELDMPILMVWGQRDGILPESHRAFFLSHLPEHARIVEPGRLGHSPYLESPGALTRHIVSFLRGAGLATEAAGA